MGRYLFNIKNEPLRVLFRKGAVETLLFLASKGSAKYSEIKRQGHVIGDRSLSRLLKELRAKSLVERKVQSTFPIATQYSLTEKGKAVAKHLDELRNLMKSEG
jgi:DNA-binding HxlR family transcriptional regulator